MMIHPPTNDVELYEVFVILVGRYNRIRTLQDCPEYLAGLFWWEFMMKPKYRRLLREADNPVKFLRKFIKTRCLRELTKVVRRERRFAVADISDLLEVRGLASDEPTPEEWVLGCELRMLAEELSRRVNGSLSKRQGQLLKMLLRKKTRREIAKGLGLSVGMVQHDVEKIRALPEVQALKALLWGD